MSAATMLACSADQIVMGAHSSLGPIDPQFVLQNQHGAHMQPVQAIIDNFEKAKKVSQTSPDELGVYLPILNQYSPGLIEQCRSAQDLSKDLVSSWLEQYMYRGQRDAGDRAKNSAEALADHDRFKSHSRHINKDTAQALGLEVASLEDDPLLHDLVLSVFHATMITFQHGPAKIIENQTDKTFMKHRLVSPVQPPPPDAAPS